jgi:GTPase SAR1 family protein
MSKDDEEIKIAVVGPGGSGKSTVYFILKF